MPRPRTQILMALAGLAGLAGFAAAASPSLEACLAECKRSQLSVTNRATCRLDCEVDAASDPEQIRARMEPASPRPTAPPRPTVPTTAASPGPANGAGCKAACAADSSLSVDDRATCTLECDLEPAPMPTGTPPPMRPPKLVPGPATPATPGPAPTPTRTGGLTWSSTRPVAAEALVQAGFLARCHATCKSGPSPREVTDFETCKLDCDMMASVLDVASGFVPDAWLEVPRPIATRDPTPVPASTATTVPAKPVVDTRQATAPAVPVRTPSSEPEPDTCAAALTRCNTRCEKAELSCRKACGRKHGSETDRETCKLGCGTDLEVCQGDCLTDNATCVNNQRGR